MTGQASRDAVAGVHEPHEAAWRPLLLLCAGVAALLILTSRRYGYHRDELYFLVAGRHPDWGY
ncbi:MAG TPA: glycosyl transferase family 39, partial [Mycobacteriales bacterium]|nr:glycosyl transferase family 39 [Mycobacteriales bacterium]